MKRKAFLLVFGAVVTVSGIAWTFWPQDRKHGWVHVAGPIWVLGLFVYTAQSCQRWWRTRHD